MQFAKIYGFRRKPEPKLKGACPVCDAPVIARCGEQRLWHWSHRSLRHCDHWWETETPWHRAWKDRFPTEWQEVIHKAPDGEKHIADVKTLRGCVIEFQHSHISPDERRKREAFYGEMVWVVDGLRLARDKKGFHDALKGRITTRRKARTFVVDVRQSALLQRWATCGVKVFFDFGESERDVRSGRRILWCLRPKPASGFARELIPVQFESFATAYRDGGRLKGFPPIKQQMLMVPLVRPLYSRRQTLAAFSAYLADRERNRPRF